MLLWEYGQKKILIFNQQINYEYFINSVQYTMSYSQYYQLVLMKKNLNHFESAKKDFQALRSHNQIPPQMDTKLSYLLSRIQKKPSTPSVIQDLPQYQKNSLDQLNIQTGTHLFCNIVNCLSGKDVVLYFRDEKAYIRKDELFSMWRQIWLTCDSNNLYIKKRASDKSGQIYQLSKLRISKNYKLYKKKHVFGACYNKKTSYLIGFDLESVCSRTNELIRGIIRDKMNRITIKNEEAEQREGITNQVSDKESKQKSIQKPAVRLSQKQIQEQVQMAYETKQEEADENTDQGVVFQLIKQQQLNGDSLYKLLKAEGNLRQMVHKNYPNKYKTQIIIDRPKSVASILDHYIKMSQWNPEIEESCLKIKVSQNSFLLQVKVKKYSYISWARQTILLATALVYRNKYFLVLRSTGEESSYNDTVKMEWKEVVQVSQSEEKGKALMSISSEFDFKGYCSVEDSGRMGLKILNSIKLFPKYFEAKEISEKNVIIFHLQAKQKLKLQNIETNHTKVGVETQNKSEFKYSKLSEGERVLSISKTSQSEKKLINKSNVSEKESRKSNISDFLPDDDQQSKQLSQVHQKIEKRLTSSASKFTEDPTNFTIYMMKSLQSQISPKLIQLVKEKAHQKYYLKHKFDQSVYLDAKKLQHTVDGPNHYILQNGNWKINQQSDLIFINEKQLQLQKDIIKMIIKQISSNIMSGKSIMNMSLPVQIFDNRSILERAAIGFGYAAKYLVPAAQTTDLIEQAKFVTLFVLGIGPLHLCLSKPFNPILGETFECRIGGIPLYLEQVSHHPPISALLIKTDDFVLHGAFHSHAQMGLNRVNGKNLSPLYLQFPKTNTYYEIKSPQMEVSGLMYGDRRYRGLGKCFVHERTNNIFIEYSIGKDKKNVYPATGKINPNELFGGIYTVTPNFGKKFKQCQNKQKFDGVKQDDIIETHVRIGGHWCLSTYFNGKKVRGVEDPLPNKIQYPEFVLPSDSNFRLDLLYKRLEDLKTANEHKEIMQNIQRRDRKLREGKIKANGKN